ncbi:PREDICTED: uncharacterized protein LOC108557659 [Nicrophorus vespilloides]|uniref:Uncharacterized protein LOC108557659 n=1 Tax=Nicrophorus vespilloides TaxID=110193 RepID=A0ABM1M5A4_NICVS|nr:PREDICTED: uncharacterized protein LOC108557659 [Nicrophorus vespilloides]
MSIGADLQVLLRWGHFLCLLPKYDPITGTFSSTPRRCYIKLTIFTVSFIYSFVGKLTVPDFNKTTPQLILILFSTIISSFLNLYTIFGSFKWAVPKIQRLFDTFNEIDSILQEGRSHRMRSYVPVFGLIHVFIITIVFVAMYIWYKHMLLTDFHYLVQDQLQFYYIFIGVAIQINVLRHIKCRFEITNRLLETMTFCENQSTMKSIFLLHEKLCNLVDIFNSLHGWHILLTMNNLIVDILLTLQLMISNLFNNSFTAILLMTTWTMYLAKVISVAYETNSFNDQFMISNLFNNSFTAILLMTT